MVKIKFEGLFSWMDSIPCCQLCALNDQRTITVKTVHACLTSKFLVQPSNADVWNRLQRLAPIVPTFRQNVRANLSNFIQDLFWRVRFSNEDFKMVEDGLASLAIVKIRT